MNDKELLLQEIKQEAENVKAIIKQEVDIISEELSKISLSGFVPNCNIMDLRSAEIFPLNDKFIKYTEECFSELERRILTFNTYFKEKLYARLQQTNFFQYDIVKTAANRTKYNNIIISDIILSQTINLKDLQTKVSIEHSLWCFCVWNPNIQVKGTFERVFKKEIQSNRNKIVELYTQELFRQIDKIMAYVENALKTAVTYQHITNDFGEDFLFSPQMMEVSENDIDSYMNSEEKDTEQLSYLVSVSVLESEKYRRIICVSRKIPSFDSCDREYDSWHNIYLLQEKNGIIRAIYCKGGYRIVKIEGYDEVYEYPEYLKKYFK